MLYCIPFQQETKPVGKVNQSVSSAHHSGSVLLTLIATDDADAPPIINRMHGKLNVRITLYVHLVNTLNPEHTFNILQVKYLTSSRIQPLCFLVSEKTRQSFYHDTRHVA
jgi:hypothetical protein